MIAANMSIDDMLAEAEPFIRRSAARIGDLPGMGFDDVCQELRILAMQMAANFDPARRVPWRAYLLSQLGRRAIDVRRANSEWTRSRKSKRTQWHYGLDFACDKSTPLDPPCPVEYLPDVDWSDVLDRAEHECPQVRAMILWAMGLTMRQVGERLGVSESRVSQMLSPRHPTHDQMRTRVCVLLGVDGRRRVVTNEPGQN